MNNCKFSKGKSIVRKKPIWSSIKQRRVLRLSSSTVHIMIKLSFMIYVLTAYELFKATCRDFWEIRIKINELLKALNHSSTSHLLRLHTLFWKNSVLLHGITNAVLRHNCYFPFLLPAGNPWRRCCKKDTGDVERKKGGTNRFWLLMFNLSL